MLNRQGTKGRFHSIPIPIIFLIFPKGRYTVAVDIATKVPGGKRLHLLGIEAGAVINDN